MIEDLWFMIDERIRISTFLQKNTTHRPENIYPVSLNESSKEVNQFFYSTLRRYVVFWSFRWCLEVYGAFFDHITLYFLFSGQVKLINPVELKLYWNPIPDSWLKIRFFRFFSLVKWKQNALDWAFYSEMSIKLILFCLRKLF